MVKHERAILKFPSPTWFVGCGNMAGAMVEGWRGAGRRPVRRGRDPAERARRSRACARSSRRSTPGRRRSSSILGFKPQKLDEVAPRAWRRACRPKTVIVSILAGVEAATLRGRFPGAGAIVRAMPNLPVAIRRGVIALYSEDADDERQRPAVASCSRPLGFAPWMPTRTSLAAIGSVAGAGPGLCRALHRRAGQGRRASAGSIESMAATIALETVLGTALDGGGDRREHGRRSRGASRAPTARPRPGSPCSTATACSTS